MTSACIIGVSGFGRVHYEMLLDARAAGSVEIAGATVINQAEEAESCACLRSLGCRVFDDYNAMLRDLAGTAELCMIPTGIPLRAVMTTAALNAGMHVLVEKPAAGCIQDVRAMKRATRAAGRIAAVAYQHMYAPATLETKRLILGGRIGTVETMKCRVLWSRDHAYYRRNNWAGRLRAGGAWVLDSPLNNAAAHYLMMMLFLAGPTEREAATPVSVEAELYRANEIESADTACVRVRTAEGITLLCYMTHACRATLEPEIRIRGTGGRIFWTHAGSAVETTAGAGTELVATGMDCLRRHIMSAVLDAARGGRSFYCDLETAARQTIVVNAAHEASAIHAIRGRTLREEDGAMKTVVPGIEDALTRAFNEEKLPHESGAAWAQPAGSFACLDYREFGKSRGGA